MALRDTQFVDSAVWGRSFSMPSTLWREGFVAERSVRDMPFAMLRFRISWDSSLCMRRSHCPLITSIVASMSWGVRFGIIPIPVPVLLMLVVMLLPATVEAIFRRTEVVLLLEAAAAEASRLAATRILSISRSTI